MGQLATNISTPAPHTVVKKDISCRKCGYNLRGLNTNTRCPECGIAVAASVSEDLLRFCDPAWVALLTRGSYLIVAGFLATVFNIILYITLFLSMGKAAAHDEFTVAFLISQLLVVTGSWLITMRDPVGIGEDLYGTARRIIRITLTIAAVETLFTLATRTFLLLPLQTIIVVQALGGIVRAAGLFFQLQYLEKLARRIPQPVLSIRAKYFRERFPAWYLFAIVGTNAIRLSSNTVQRHDLAYVTNLIGLLDLVVLGFAIANVRMMFSFAQSFKRQQMLAGESWATHTAAPAPQ